MRTGKRDVREWIKEENLSLDTGPRQEYIDTQCNPYLQIISVSFAPYKDLMTNFDNWIAPVDEYDNADVDTRVKYYECARFLQAQR